MSGQLHVKNHYIPQLYLQNWSIHNEIHVYNNLVSHENVPLFQKKHISKICYLNHLYTNRVEKTDYDDFELWINQVVEMPYKITQDKILNGTKLNFMDYQNISRFVLAQYLRVPKFYAIKYKSLVKGLESSFEDMLTDIVSKAEEKIKHKTTLKLPETKGSQIEMPIGIRHEKFENQNYLKVEALLGRKAWLSTIKSMVENTLDKIRDYKWQIVKSIDGFEWYTSDNPVTLLNYWSNEKYNFDGAWKVKHTVVLMPISPQYLLFCEVGCRQSFVNTIAWQTFINKCIIENSFLQVYSTKPDEIIHQTRKRVVDVNEYKRISGIFSNWHNDQSKGEDEFLSYNINGVVK